MIKALLLISAMVVLAVLPATAQGQSEAYFVLRDPPQNSTFVFKLTDPARIQEARNLIATHTRKIVLGVIIKQPVYYNPNWHFHFDPDTVGFADTAIELCDGSPEGIEEHLDDAYSMWCPWAGRLEEEIPPPPKPGPGNLKPTVSVTDPYQNNAINPATPGNLRISINADDPDGVVTKVELWAGTQTLPSIKIGEASTAPYRFDWINLPSGTQTIYAVVTDDQRASTNSKTITFTVRVPATGNLLDDTDFFVRQQYRDFLYREPDNNGLQFWKDNVDRCGTDAICREVKRIDTSAAFFLSIEFQETGFFVHRFYRASFGRRPLREELVPDAQAVAAGLVVNAPGWQELLAANKQAFAAAWVGRSAFAAIYDPLPNSEFVDQLLRNSGGTYSAAQRNLWLDALNANVKSRAAVLSEIVESSTFRDAELSAAFVEMQYIGYLRRNPQDPPDNGLGGYNFWLDKLTQFHGDYRAAEMVKAFLISPEYKQRFGR